MSNDQLREYLDRSIDRAVDGRIQAARGDVKRLLTEAVEVSRSVPPERAESVRQRFIAAARESAGAQMRSALRRVERAEAELERQQLAAEDSSQWDRTRMAEERHEAEVMADGWADWEVAGQHLEAVAHDRYKVRGFRYGALPRLQLRAASDPGRLGGERGKGMTLTRRADELLDGFRPAALVAAEESYAAAVAAQRDLLLELGSVDFMEGGGLRGGGAGLLTQVLRQFTSKPSVTMTDKGMVIESPHGIF